jgi:hypothetical protein
VNALAERPVKYLDLTDPQADVFESEARFRVLVAGRRFGKTFLSAAELATAAGEKPRSVCWYIAPTYRMAKEIAWDAVKKTIPQSQLAKRPNETELSVDLINGSRIALKGADNPDSLRGLGLNFVVCDEFAMLEPELWTEVIRPALADRRGRALFVGTPMGYNWAYDAYLKGLQPNSEGWKSWSFTTLQGWNVDADEVAAARSSMDPRVFRQEFEASFETLQGRVYDNFDRRPFPDGNVDASVKDTGGELLVGQDFNVNPMSSVIGVKVLDELHIIDSLQIQTSNTEEMAQEIKRRYPGRRIVMCPDPSANQRRTSAAAGVTDITILQKHGFWVDVSPHAILIPDRVNAVQAMLKDATGRRRLKIHPDAMPLIRALDGQTYKKDTSIPDKSLGLDHPVDALGYLVWQRFNLLVNRATVIREVLI